VKAEHHVVVLPHLFRLGADRSRRGCCQLQSKIVSPITHFVICRESSAKSPIRCSGAGTDAAYACRQIPVRARSGNSADGVIPRQTFTHPMIVARKLVFCGTVSRQSMEKSDSRSGFWSAKLRFGPAPARR